MIATTDPTTAARAAALFVSTLSTADRPTPADVEAAIAYAVRTHGGDAGLAADVAQEYGEHPELAAARMSWARGLVEVVDRLATARGSLAIAA